jgi:hypothetical protein
MPATAVDDAHAFARLVDGLRPWLDDLVIVGGWAHRLYRLLRNTQPPAYQPLRTRDADLAFAATARLAGDIGAALEHAGFHEEPSGEHTPPVTWYRLGGGDQGFYAEFLAPLTGSGVRRSRGRRDGTPDATVTTAGVTAQKLRYIELLLTDPGTVRLDATTEVPVKAPADVRLPNPVSFIAQKLLIHARRPASKRAQDALYIHDTLDLFGPALETLRATWRAGVRPTLAPRTATQIERLAHAQFSAVTDTHRAAARMPQDRALSPERLRAACAYGLEEIFGA